MAVAAPAHDPANMVHDDAPQKPRTANFLPLSYPYTSSSNGTACKRHHTLVEVPHTSTRAPKEVQFTPDEGHLEEDAAREC